MTSISNFGQTGPYRDYKASELVMNGFHAMQYLGIPEREPQSMTGYLVQCEAGMTAATVTLAAFYGAVYKGIGQYVDISMLETVLSSADRKTTYIGVYTYTGLIAQRQMIFVQGIAPIGAFQCKDGYVQASIITPQHWTKFCGLLERLYGDNIVERFPSAWDIDKREEFDAVVTPFFLEHTKSEIHTMAREVGIAITPMSNASDLVNDPHLREREFFVEVDHPVVGKMIHTGAPFRMSETPWQMRRPAPLLGQHNEEVYGQMLGYTKQELMKLHELCIM
jgi:crotonobetainyl-CoA:carnitine CoA-transferase CaiB-like acyl-CoA transferase